MSRSARSFALTFILFSCLPVFSQPQTTPARPQTARQALIEMITLGGDAVQKHLTVEVQQLLKSSGRSNALNPYAASMKVEPGLETFDTGDVLLSFYSDPAKTTKYEIRVDSDDLSGDEDTLSLSIHSFGEGKQQDDGFGLFSSHFSVSMKLQQNVWRLNKVSIGADFPIGDPEFIKKTLLKTRHATSAATSGGFYTSQPNTDVHLHSNSSESQIPTLPPEEIVSFLGTAERTFAATHAETGFTCSLKDLTELSGVMGVNEQVNTGTYNGYRFALSGCAGTPAGSYQIIAEPLVLEKGEKAFCTDATGNVRVSDDGRGTTCLISGKVPRDDSEEGGMIGFRLGTGESKPAKQQ